MKYGSCPHCGRRYRSAAARELARRYEATHEDLRGGPPAEHLRPIDYSVSDDQAAKRARSAHFRQTGDLEPA